MTDCDFSRVRELQKFGHEVLYIISLKKGRQCGGLLDLTSYDLKPGNIYTAQQFEEIKFYSKFLDISNMYIGFRTMSVKDYANWKLSWDLARIIKEWNADRLLINWQLGFSEVFLYRFYRKMVMTVHDPFSHSGQVSILSEIKRWFSFKLSKSLILLNGSQKERFINEYHVKQDKVFISQLGICMPLNYLIEVKGLADIQLPKEYVLFFGQIYPYKGVDILCEAMKIVHKYNPSLHCIIAGKNKCGFDVRPYKDLDYITFDVRYIDSVECATYIKKSLFVVCPYRDATQSGVVSSAFALAKPVLATNVGGLGETVMDGITGKLIAPNDIQQLAQVMLAMSEDKEKLKRYSENIKEIFWAGKNSWTNICKHNLLAYE